MRFVLLLLVLLLTLPACQSPSDPGGAAGPGAVTLSVVSGDGQRDSIRAVLPEPLVVRATRGGRATSGVSVDWEVPEVQEDRFGRQLFCGGFEATDRTTGSDGRAQATWRLGMSSWRACEALAVAQDGGTADTAVFKAELLPGFAHDVRSVVASRDHLIAGGGRPYKPQVGNEVLDISRKVAVDSLMATHGTVRVQPHERWGAEWWVSEPSSSVRAVEFEAYSYGRLVMEGWEFRETDGEWSWCFAYVWFADVDCGEPRDLD